MIPPKFSDASVSGSNFGDNAHLHFGDNHVHSQEPPRDQSNSSADEQFLSDLSSIHPTNQYSSVKRPRTKTAQEGSQNWSAKTRFDEWFFSSDQKNLWIQDETLSQEGSSLLVSDIIEGLEEQNRLGREAHNNNSISSEKTTALAYFYCSCLSVGDLQQWTPSHVLGGLIYMLLQSSDRSELLQTTREMYGRRLKASLVDRSRFELLVEILLHVLLSVSLSSLPRITLIVEAIDQCGADAEDIGIPDLVDAMNQCVEQVQHLKWIISSRTGSASSQVLSGLDSDHHILKLSYTDVAKGLGLSSMMETVLDVGARMQRMFQDSKRRVEKAPDGYRWFQYSKAGGNWLKGPQQQSDGSTGASVVWYEKNTTLAYEPSPLALHIADDVCPRVGLQLAVVYYACHSALNTNLDYSDSFKDTFKAQPAVVLFCMFCQMVHGAHYGWAKVAVDLPKKLRKTLELLTSSMTKTRKERQARTTHPEDPLTAENGTHLGENIQDITTEFPLSNDISPTGESDLSAKIAGWYRDLDVEDRYIPIIVDLIASVASRLPNDLLLVLDSLEQMDCAMWKRTLQMLRDRMSSRVRILLCGISEKVDKIWAEETAMTELEDWRKSIGAQLDEHSEYNECLQSLDFDTIHARRDAVADAWPNTNKWLWCNEAFEYWAATGGVLWVHGKAGSGKSVLAKTILKNLSERLGPDSEQISRWFVCDWFYNAREAEIGKSHSAMLRSLAYEILRYDEKAYECAKNHYRALDPGAGDPVWSLSELRSLLYDLGASPSTPKKVTIIDALDESEDGDEGTPENRLSIVRSLCEIAGQSGGQMRIILLSRPDPHIASQLKHCHQINMQEHNHKDIDTLVDSGLDFIREAWVSVCGFSIMKQPLVNRPSEPPQNKEAHFGLPLEEMPQPARRRDLFSACQLPQSIALLDEQEDELREIKRYLIKHASGVVLWVCLVLHELRDCVISKEKAFTLRDLAETLYRLPGDLDDLYAHMILGLNPSQDSQKTTTTKKILMWVIGSAPWGPLTLKHLWEALALPEETTLGCEWTREAISRGRFEIGQNWDRFCQIVYRYCGPLIEIRRDRKDSWEFASAFQSNSFYSDPSPGKPNFQAEAQDTLTVHLLHQTTKTFLANKERSGQLYVNSDLASIFIVDACYVYLGLRPPRPDKLVFKNDLQKMKALTRSDFSLVHPDAKAIKDYARGRPLYDFAMRVVESYFPFHRFSIMESMQGGDGSHDLEDCFVAYCILDVFYLDVFQTGRETGSEAYNVRSFFCQCCLRGGVDMLEAFFDLVQKYQDPGSRPRISGRRAYEMLRGAVDALQQLETSSVPEPRCIWDPTLESLVEYYSTYAVAVDTTSTAAVCELQVNDVDEPIDRGLEFLEDLQRRCRKCPAHPSHGHATEHQIVEIHGDSVKVPMWRVYKSIGQVIAWLKIMPIDAPQHDLNDTMTPPCVPLAASLEGLGDLFPHLNRNLVSQSVEWITYAPDIDLQSISGLQPVELGASCEEEFNRNWSFFI